MRKPLCVLLLAAIAWARPCTLSAGEGAAVEPSEVAGSDTQVKGSAQTEEQIWALEEKELAQCCGKGLAKYQRRLVGVVTIDKDSLAREGNVGKFTANGKTYILRLAGPELLNVLHEVSNTKSILLNGKVRCGEKYFVAEGVSFNLPGEGASPPAMRKKRGGI